MLYCWYCHRAKPSVLDGEPWKHSIFLLAISLEIIMINHKETKKKRKEKKGHSDSSCSPSWWSYRRVPPWVEKITEANHQLSSQQDIQDWLKTHHFWQSRCHDLERKQRSLLKRKQREMSDVRPKVQSNILGWFSREN